MGSHVPWKHITLLKSYAFASTLTYRGGYVCLCGTKGVWTRKHLFDFSKSLSMNQAMRAWVPTSLENTSRFCLIICACLSFGLPRWFCMSLWDSGDLDSETFFVFSKSLSFNQSMRTWYPTSLETHHMFGIMRVCLYFGLPSWICMSL